MTPSMSMESVSTVSRRGYPKKRVTDVKRRILSRARAEDRGYESACLIWLGEKDKFGYGKIKRNGKYVQAHWVIKGDPPEGYEVDHLCHQRDCVRPSHLEYVTRAENTKRRASLGNRASVTDEERSVVLDALQRGESLSAIARATGLSMRTVGRIRDRQ